MHRRRGVTTNRGRWWPTAVLVVWSLVWAWALRTPSGISWHFFAEGSDRLFGEAGLRLYALHPEYQIGPLTFVVARGLTAVAGAHALEVAQVSMALAAPLMIWWMRPLVRGTAGMRPLLAGLVLIPTWTVLAVRWAHLDDVLALALVVLGVRLVVARRPVGGAWALAGAVLAKPWTVGVLPVLALAGGEAVMAGLVALVAIAVGWGVFVVGDPATLEALRPRLTLVPSSVLRVFGYRGIFVPDWVRTAQIGGGLAAGAMAVWRRRWPGVLLVLVAVRLALDPQDIGYYAAGAVTGAVLFDLAGTRWRLPWTSIVTSIALWQPFVVDYGRRFELAHGLGAWWFAHPGPVGIVHLGWCLAMPALVWLVGPTENTPAVSASPR